MFKVGDKVTSERFGEGVVKGVYLEKNYPVLVEFDSCGQTFTKDGVYNILCTDFRDDIKLLEPPQFTKADLVTGMFVITKNGLTYIVIKDHELLVSASRNGYMTLGSYNDDLSHEDNNDFSIKKVYSLPFGMGLLLDESEFARKLLWERLPFVKEVVVKEMTVDDLSKALGYTVKVVGS